MSSHHNESKPQPQYDRQPEQKYSDQDTTAKLRRFFADVTPNPVVSSQPVAIPQPVVSSQPVSASPVVAVRPVWDREKRELRLGDKIVKRFKWPAENQERVLDAFEEQGWPVRIGDPLASHPKICPKRRLHDTLKCLNRKQVNGAIKFRGDGTGLGVLLEIVAEKNPVNH